MKQLQNDFTTPEQSKRLLELGVPADSANCIRTLYRRKGDDKQIEALIESYSSTKRTDINRNEMEQYPCWTVGRLMEIFDICFPESNTACWPPYYELDTDYITYVVNLYERGIMELDFSKLEE